MKLHTGSQEEKNKVFNEELGDKKSNSPKSTSLLIPNSSVFSEHSPFAIELGKLFNVDEGNVTVDVGSRIKITCSFGEVVEGTIIEIQDNHIYLDSGWSWEEVAHIRTLKSATDTKLIQKIEVYHG